MEMKIYLANLAAYNNGFLVGEWIDLPCSEDELKEKIEAILNQWNDGFSLSEEYAIHDYELPFKVSEYSNPYKINEWAEVIEKSNIEDNVVEAILENWIEVEEALQVIENEEYRIWENCSDMSDVAYAFYDETGMLQDIEKVINANYIDWESIGRDMDLEGTYLFAGNNTYVEITQ